MDITRVGFGAWAAGGGGYAFAWSGQDDESAVAAIRRAIALGVNWIDTAPMYGLGHPEELVARAVRDLPDEERPFVFTKCGLIFDEADPTQAPAQVGSAASIRREVESSLRRLEVDRIDLLHMHWPPLDGSTIDEYWQTFLDLKGEGKVRAVGLSNHSVRKLEAAEALGHVDTLQPPLSLINRKATAELTGWCAAHETGVIAYSPSSPGF